MVLEPDLASAMRSKSPSTSSILLRYSSLQPCTRCFLCETGNYANCRGEFRKESTLCIIHWYSGSLSDGLPSRSACGTVGAKQVFFLAASDGSLLGSATVPLSRAAFAILSYRDFFGYNQIVLTPLLPNKNSGMVPECKALETKLLLRTSQRQQPPAIWQRDTNSGSSKFNFCSEHSPLAASVLCLLSQAPFYSSHDPDHLWH